MDNTEFSTQFDILWNNISSNQAPGLNEYEKSVFLTMAESQLVKEFFNARVDGVGGGFDGSIKRQYDFSSLVKTEVLTEVTGENLVGVNKLYNDSKVYKYPTDYFLTVNEDIKDSIQHYTVMPIDYAEFERLRRKPYPYPLKREAWKLIIGSKEVTLSGNKKTTIPLVEIIGKFKSSVTYTIRYVKTLKPIILVNLSEFGDLTIGGLQEKTPCELPKECHQEILERAIALAKIAWLGGSTAQSQAGQKDNK